MRHRRGIRVHQEQLPNCQLLRRRQREAQRTRHQQTRHTLLLPLQGPHLLIPMNLFEAIMKNKSRLQIRL